MNCRHRPARPLALVLMAISLALGGRAPISPAASDDHTAATTEKPHGLLRLDGPVLFPEVRTSKLGDLPILDGVQFGPYFPPSERRAEQYLTYWIEQAPMPGGRKAPFLAVYYNVTRDGSYNGLWIKLGGADLSMFRRGELVLRLRQFGPLNKVEVFAEDGKPLKDLDCTDRLQVELKSSHLGADGKPRGFKLQEFVYRRHKDQQERSGYFDLRIPLEDFGLTPYLDRMAELVITFENQHIPVGQLRGNLGIRKIVVTPGRNQDIDDPEFSRFASQLAEPAPPTELELAQPVQGGGEAALRTPVRLNGPELIRFDHDLDHLAVPRAQFGIFRDQDPRPEQFIEEGWTAVDLPHKAHPMGFLRLSYEVPSKYNGWWLKLHAADWRRFEAGALVLRLRPGRSCTPIFKLELKAREGGRPYFVYVRLLAEQIQSVAERGYANVAIPLRQFGLRDLSHMAELVIVFESSRIPAAYQKGELLLESIRLVLDEAVLDRGPSPTLLDDLGSLAFRWFQDNRHPETGQVLDRSPNLQGRARRERMSSVASTGYFLTLLPEWARGGWLTRDEARRQALQTLRFVLERVAHHRGMLYHFVNWETGQGWKGSEVSTLDSAIFFNGCMVVAQAFQGEVAELANALIDRAEWSAFLVRHPETGKELLALGWSPETGLLGGADVRSSEMAMPLFLAVGSTIHPIDPRCWYNTAVHVGEVAGESVMNPTHPLFTSYDGLGWHDLKGRRDRDGVDLFANARRAALANRAFCRQLAGKFATFQPAAGGWWGLSAGDAKGGYVAAGPVYGDSDGTVWPLAALASLNVVPDEVTADLARWRASPTWRKACGPYGLVPFNLADGWIGRDLVGIDLGSFAVALANQRHRTAWELWKRHPVAQAALRKLEWTHPQ